MERQSSAQEETPMDALVVRPARPGDRDAVLAFCERIWGEHDYIGDVWDDWLADPTGTLLVAELGGRPVGTCHMRLLTEDEAWLEGIRVDPDTQRRGVGRTLTSRAMVMARERGAAVVRLLVDADNLPSQRLIERFGFTRIAELARYRAPAAGAALAPSDAAPTTPSEGDFERLWDWLEHSNLAPLNGGVAIASWAARAVTEPLLRAHLAAGEVWLLEEWGAIAALAIAAPAADGDEAETPIFEIRYLDGSAEGIGRLALALRAVAASWRESARVEVWLPNLLILRDAMAGAGYDLPDPDDALWLYAHPL